MVKRSIAALVGVVVATTGCALIAMIDDVDYRSGLIDEAGMSDTSAVAEAGKSDAQEAGDDPCDRDHDGYRSLECGGTDCDDDDGRRHPDAGFVSAAPPPGKDGDWNCDGTITKEYPKIYDHCVEAPPCEPQSGWSKPVACGETAFLFLCAAQGTGCVQSPGVVHTQGCR